VLWFLVIGSHASHVLYDTLNKLATKSDIAPKVDAIADSVVNGGLTHTFSKTLSVNWKFVLSILLERQIVNVAVTNTASNYFVTWTSSVR